MIDSAVTKEKSARNDNATHNRSTGVCECRTSKCAARFSGNISRHALASGFPGNRGLAPLRLIELPENLAAQTSNDSSRPRLAFDVGIGVNGVGGQCADLCPLRFQSINCSQHKIHMLGAGLLAPSKPPTESLLHGTLTCDRWETFGLWAWLGRETGHSASVTNLAPQNASRDPRGGLELRSDQSHQCEAMTVPATAARLAGWGRV